MCMICVPIRKLFVMKRQDGSIDVIGSYIKIRTRRKNYLPVHFISLDLWEERQTDVRLLSLVLIGTNRFMRYCCVAFIRVGSVCVGTVMSNNNKQRRQRRGPLASNVFFCCRAGQLRYVITLCCMYTEHETRHLFRTETHMIIIMQFRSTQI